MTLKSDDEAQTDGERRWKKKKKEIAEPKQQAGLLQPSSLKDNFLFYNMEQRQAFTF